MSEVTLRGRRVPYTLVRHPRSRHVRVTVRREGVRVSAPPRHPRREVESFLRARADWVLGHVDRLAAAAPPAPADGALLPLLDGTIELGLRPGPRDRWRFRAEDARLSVEVADPARAEALVESWYRALARDWFRARCDAQAGVLGVRYGRLSVRDGRTRWASCSSRGTLSFSWRLMMAPARVGEYVVVHELAHLVEANHSPAFWALVARVWPGWREDREWLRRRGHLLELGPVGVASAGPTGRAAR